MFFMQLFLSVPVGVGQVYGCDSPWTGGLILLALLLSSPTICFHAMVDSAAGMLSGEKQSPICTDLCILSAEATVEALALQRATWHYSVWTMTCSHKWYFTACVCWLNYLNLLFKNTFHRDYCAVLWCVVQDLLWQLLTKTFTQDCGDITVLYPALLLEVSSMS